MKQPIDPDTLTDAQMLNLLDACQKLADATDEAEKAQIESEIDAQLAASLAESKPAAA